MATPFWKGEQARHWALSAAVLCALGGAVAGQIYLDQAQRPFTAPRMLNADKSNAPSLWERAGRAAAVATALDRASEAARRSDRAALALALEDLRQLKAASRAEPLAQAAAEEATVDAIRLDVQARDSKGSQLAALRARAAEKYREALRLSPKYDSADPQLINAVGYFLAERGTSAADFREAERLTRRALEMWDKSVGDREQDDPKLADEFLSRANTRDSLAWALYRQGRYIEALREQQQAVVEATIASRALDTPIPVSEELHYHLGEIHRALKQWDDAREQYQKVLKLKPGDELALRALKQLPPEAGSKKAPAGKSPRPGARPPRAPAPQPLPTAEPEFEPEPDTPIVPGEKPLVTRLFSGDNQNHAL